MSHTCPLFLVTWSEKSRNVCHSARFELLSPMKLKVYIFCLGPMNSGLASRLRKAPETLSGGCGKTPAEATEGPSAPGPQPGPGILKKGTLSDAYLGPPRDIQAGLARLNPARWSQLLPEDSLFSFPHREAVGLEWFSSKPRRTRSSMSSAVFWAPALKTGP